jgi:hypothetical protein
VPGRSRPHLTRTSLYTPLRLPAARDQSGEANAQEHQRRRFWNRLSFNESGQAALDLLMGSDSNAEKTLGGSLSSPYRRRQCAEL